MAYSAGRTLGSPTLRIVGLENLSLEIYVNCCDWVLDGLEELTIEDCRSDPNVSSHVLAQY